MEKQSTKVVFMVFLVISGVVEGNPRIGLFLNKCITLVLTLLEAQHDTDFVTGDEVDGGTVLTSKSLCA